VEALLTAVGLVGVNRPDVDKEQEEEDDDDREADKKEKDDDEDDEWELVVAVDDAEYTDDADDSDILRRRCNIGKAREFDDPKDEMRSDEVRKEPMSRSNASESQDGDLKECFNVTRRKLTRPGCPLVSDNRS